MSPILMSVPKAVRKAIIPKDPFCYAARESYDAINDIYTDRPELPTDTSLRSMIDGRTNKQWAVIKSASGSPVAFMINRKRSGRGWEEHPVRGEGSRRPAALAHAASRPSHACPLTRS